MKTRVTVLFIVLFLTHLVAFNATAQTWNYQAYFRGDRSAPGYVTLENKDGGAVFTMIAGFLNACYQGNLNAVVAKTEAITVITIIPKLFGCEEVRFVIRNDGTGGQREVKSGSDWVWDGLNRNLTIRK